MHTERIAIIDIGSNTIRLVIYGINEYFDVEELHNIKTPARLAECLEQDGNQFKLNAEGFQRLQDALESFKVSIKQFEVDTLKALATAAIRQSSNSQEIIDQMYEKTGIRIQLLSEADEAMYGQYAVIHTMNVFNGVTIDMGGASTEITLFEDNQMVEFHSFPFGTVNLKEKFFQDKAHNDQDAIDAVKQFLKNSFKSLSWLKKLKYPVVAMGGSARNIANVYQRQIHYPMAGVHNYAMTVETLEETLKLFQNTNYEDMDDIDGLSSDRVDIIIPATIAFIELMKQVKANDLLISGQGIREGIVLYHINHTYNMPIDNEQIRARTISQISRNLPVNTIGAYLRVNLCINLYQQICRLGILEYDYERHVELEFAAYLYRFGSFVSSESDSQHTFYLISSMNLFGFSHKKRLRLALLASYRNRSLFKQYIEDYKEWFTEEELDELIALGGLLKFSVALNNSKTNPITHMKLVKDSPDKFTLKVYHDRPVLAEEYRTDRHKKHLERTLKGNLDIQFIESKKE